MDSAQRFRRIRFLIVVAGVTLVMGVAASLTLYELSEPPKGPSPTSSLAALILILCIVTVNYQTFLGQQRKADQTPAQRFHVDRG